MTKTNAVAMNDMELDMVAGGGFFDMFVPKKPKPKKEEESMLSQAITAGAVLGLAIFVFGKMLTRGC